MKTKKSRSVGNTEQSAPIIIKSGGAGGVALPLIGVAALIGTYVLVVKPAIAQSRENKAEGDTSPEGQVANQFKNVFGPKDNANWVVNDSDYKTAALLLTNANKELVFKKYRALTDRNLSDDIAKHISPDIQSKASKIQQYNSKSGKLFSITPEGKIKFEVVKGDNIRFAPGQTTPVTFFQTTGGIILKEINDAKLTKKLASDPKTVLNTISISVKPNTRLFPVLATREITYSGIQTASDFFKYVRPYVKTSKTFAAIQILVGKDPKSGKPVIMWVDARDLVTFSKKPLKGLGSASSLLI